MVAALSVLVLSEDSAGDSHDTMVALAKKLLQLVEPHCHTHRIAFEPVPEALRTIVRANRWKSRHVSDQRKQVSLLRQIATKLGEERGFVLFHVDGDVTWSNRRASQNRAAFESRIVAQVRRLLAPIFADGEVEARLTRLCLVMPFYSIESWLYQNTEQAIRICTETYSARDVAVFERWRDERGLLDEVDRPKERVCLAGRHNKELATVAFPHEAVYEAGKSFAAVVAALAESDGLRPALRQTWHHPPAE